MSGIAIPRRKISSSKEESYSLSPEDKQFIPHFLAKKDTISLKVPFHNELKAESIQQNHYLDSGQRAAYKITCKDGLFYNAQGFLLDGPQVFVLFPDYRLYGASVFTNLSHSYVSSGLELKGAGILYFASGHLITLSNDSGHYKPTRAEMQDALQWFSAQNLHKTFIFEDHSDQHEDQEFNGIKYSHVNFNPDSDRVALTPIQNKDLVSSLSLLKKEAMSGYDGKLEALIEQLSIRAQNGDDSVYFSAPKAQETIQVSSSTTDENNILTKPDLKVYTCLQFAKDDKTYSSRFNGVLKISL